MAPDVGWDYTLHLRISDLDYLGHITAAAYLVYFEEARAAWLAETWQIRLPAYVVARQELQYVREVLVEDSPLTISIVPVRLGNASFDIEESLVTNSGDCRNRSRATLVNWDPAGRSPRPLSDTQRASLAAQMPILDQ
jgi:acyl-CoA thioester hydrolase